MSSAPSVLLLDEGDLDHVHSMLKRIGCDYVRLGPSKLHAFEPPRDLLITSGSCTRQMPELRDESSSGSTWLCIHNQDYLPLRERLRKLGVHILVQNALDPESLRLLILQLLHRGPERRRGLRLPLGGPLSYRIGSMFGPGRLAELSGEMCRFLSSEAIDLGTAVSVVLPATLGGGEEFELQGHVVRSVECESGSGEAATSTVLALNDLDPEARAQLEKLVRGEQLGTRVTPLAERCHAEPAQEASGSESSEPGAEPRQHPRHDYGREVKLLDFDDAGAEGAVLGQDLSVDGVRIAGVPNLSAGTRVTLALYGGDREEPVVMTASVVRQIGGEAGVAALRFIDTTSAQEQQIERLLGAARQVESLRGPPEDDSRVVIARMIESPGLIDRF